MTSEAALLEVGRIGRAHGVRGDLYISLLTDRVERVAAGARLQAKGKWLTVESSRPVGARWLVHFVGIADRTAAEAWVNTALLAEALAELPAEGWYVHDLIGATVVDTAGIEHGSVVSVVANPAHDLLELEGGALVPIVFVTEFLPGRITIDPPEGLFDLLD